PIFTGSSQFSQDFQSLIQRAVKIASLPITQLNSELTGLQDQSTALDALDTKFSALGNAISGIQNAVSGASFNSTVSDSSVVGVTLGAGVSEGNYSIEVLDAGAYSSSLTSSTWGDTPNAPGQTHTYELWIDGVETDVTPPDNSAQSVAAAINVE